MSQQPTIERHGMKKGIYLLPNLITTANLFCGYFAIISSINGQFLRACWLIFLAGIFDMLDGRVARLTKTQTRFGLEYDSLVDLTSFGLAPSILMYKWVLFQHHHVGWAAAFVFFACGALRLARFNVHVSDDKKNFQGLPIPMAAGVLITYIIFYSFMFEQSRPESLLYVIMTFFLGLLMVSSFPYYSFKVVDKNKKTNFFVLVLILAGLFIFLSSYQVMLFVMAVTYALSGVITQIIRSPKKIKAFVQFLNQFFQAHPAALDETNEDQSKNKKVSLKIVDTEPSHQDEKKYG